VGAAVLRYRGLLATDARGDRLPAWFSLRPGRVEIRVADRGARYPLRIDPFVQQGAKLVGTGAVGFADQGWSVALSGDGDTALIGGPDDNDNLGAAWVFTRSGSTWSQQAKLVGTGAVGAAQQGAGVALSGDGNTALIGGHGDDSSTGAAWVFTRSGSTWSQQGAKLVGTGAVGPAEQGYSVALSGDGSTALIGGPFDDSNIGAAWVFTRSGSTWSQQGSKLVGTDAVGPAEQGYSVALSGDGNAALIGGLLDDNQSGAAWVFTRSGSTWSQQGSKLVGTGAVGAAKQGASVALSGDGNTALIGGYNDNSGTGAAWVFTRSGSTWSQQGSKLVGTGAAGPAKQGAGVALSGDGNTVLIGGPGDNYPAGGAAWVFTRSGSTWSQQGAKLVGTGVYAPAGQGASVALSGDGSTALIGGPTDNGGFGVGVGAAWVFARSGSTWSQQGAKLVGTGAVRNAALQGYSVALSSDGNTALIGGEGDDHFAGAAWVFTRSGSTWSQQGAKLVGTGAVGNAGQGASVALSGDGNTALIGGPADNQYLGSAWVFTRSGSTWSQQGAKLVGTGGAGEQGHSVALSGDGNTALIGGPTDNNEAGAAWVFTRSGSTWTQQGAKLVGTGAVAFPEQGSSVALSGDGNTALIGGGHDNGGVGAAWVFTLSGSTWSQQGPKLVGTGAVGAARQGASVVLSGDGSTALIGGPADNQYLGSAWVFTRSGSTWSQQGSKLVGTGARRSYAEQGSSVALSGDGSTALIGGPADNGTGAVWAFTRSGSIWSQQGPKLVGTGAVGAAGQGFSVALSGDGNTALVGGPFDDKDTGFDDNDGAGAAWVFVIPPPPAIDSFAPGSGITGRKVTITGTNLSGATSVKFGSLEAPFTVASDTEIDARVPNGAVAGKISVTTPGGTRTSSQSFTPTLSIASVSPTSGPSGTVVDIRGIGFTPGSTVNFSGTAATVSYVGSGEVKATVPSTATTGPITLTNTSSPAGTVKSRTSYTVTPHVAPTISSFTPGSGITGRNVAITGTYLSGNSSVKFGNVAASGVTVYSPTKLGAIVPNGAVAGQISVTTADGTATSSQSFTPTLSITGFSPTSGPPGTVVDIQGIGFTPGSTVQFNGAAASVSYISSGEVKATVPSSATTGRITLTNTSSPAGTVGSAKKYGVS
jgi:hypothetical protein